MYYGNYSNLTMTTCIVAVYFDEQDALMRSSEEGWDENRKFDLAMLSRVVLPSDNSNLSI